MKKIEFYIHLNDHSDIRGTGIVEVPDSATQDEIDYLVRCELYEYYEWGWTEVDRGCKSSG